jgi:hypothetical protein
MTNSLLEEVKYIRFDIINNWKSELKEIIKIKSGAISLGKH